MRKHKIGLDHRKEFDEVFLQNASVHIERMNDREYWMGIDAPGFSPLRIVTGVDDSGTWYFLVEEDIQRGRTFKVERKVGKPRR